MSHFSFESRNGDTLDWRLFLVLGVICLSKYSFELNRVIGLEMLPEILAASSVNFHGNFAKLEQGTWHDGGLQCR